MKLVSLILEIIINSFQVNGKTPETTSVQVEDKYDSAVKSKNDCDSSLIADIIEREQNCNSSNSNNSGYSGELKIFHLQANMNRICRTHSG